MKLQCTKQKVLIGYAKPIRWELYSAWESSIFLSNMAPQIFTHYECYIIIRNALICSRGFCPNTDILNKHDFISLMVLGTPYGVLHILLTGLEGQAQYIVMWGCNRWTCPTPCNMRGVTGLEGLTLYNITWGITGLEGLPLYNITWGCNRFRRTDPV